MYLSAIALALTLLYTPADAQASDQGYTCSGQIIKKDSSSNDVSAANLICCEGDPHQAILLGNGGPTSCTAGKAVPLTKEPKAGSGGTSATATSNGGASAIASVAASTVSVASDNGGVPAMATHEAWMGAVVAALGILVAI